MQRRAFWLAVAFWRGNWFPRRRCAIIDRKRIFRRHDEPPPRMATQEPRRVPQALSADVERAEQCDATGAHSDAITHLAAGARKHDVEAMTRLGKRLLVGDRAPCLPKDGAGLIAEASRRGGAEAAAVLAVLYAVGASRGHDVQAGLESLIVAAERGWPAAQAQLEVLAAEAVEHGRSGRRGWTRRRHAARRSTGARSGRAIDLRAWQSAPASTDLERESAGPLVSQVREPASVPLVHRASRGTLVARVGLRGHQQRGHGRAHAHEHGRGIQSRRHRSRVRARPVADVCVPRRAVAALRGRDGAALRRRRGNHGALRLHRPEPARTISSRSRSRETAS